MLISKPSHKQKAITLGLFITFSFVFFETFSNTFELWTNYGRGYSHGLLLLLISIYLAQDSYKNTTQPTLSPSPSYYLLVPTFFLGIAWSLAALIGLGIMQQLLLPLIFLTSTAALFGVQKTKFLRFPALFIYLGLPFWDLTNPFLQMLTVKAVQLMINKTGLTAHIHGTYIEIPSGTFHVAQSCAGMRYMLIALTLTTLHSYLSFRALLPRFTIIGIGLLLSLLANWIRVYTVVYIGYQTQMQSSIVNDHDTLGWIVFAIVLAPIFFLTSFLNRFDKPSSETSAKSRITIPCAPNSVVSVLLFAIFATTASLASLPQFIASGSSFEPPPKRFARWESIPHKQTAYTSFENPTVQVNSVYRDFSKSISLYIAHYATQNEVSELVSNDNHQIISPWRIIKTQKIIAFKGDALKAVTIKNGESYKQMINWYKIGARRTSSEQHAKAYQLLHLLSLKTSGNFVSVSKPCSDIDHCNSVKELTEFIKELSTHYKEI